MPVCFGRRWRPQQWPPANAGIELSLFERPTPRAWAYANHTSENSGEVALIGKAAGKGHIQQRQSIIAQPLLGNLDAMGKKPVVRGDPHGAAKRARKMAHGQLALPSHLREQHATIKVGTENFLGAPHLPRCKPSPDRP
jgi:hypothetical protein